MTWFFKKKYFDDQSSNFTIFGKNETGFDLGEPTNSEIIFVDDAMSDWGSKSTSKPDQKNHRLRVSIKPSVLRMVFSLLLCGVFLIIIRTAYFQIIIGSHYKKLAENNRSRIEYIPTERGVIFDCRGVVLVKNVPQFIVTITPADLPRVNTERREVIGRVAELLSLNPRDIENRLIDHDQNSSAAISVADDINHEQAVLISVLSAKWPAIQLLNGVRRDYPFSLTTNSLSHLLGFEGIVGKEDLEQNKDYLLTDRIGRTGLERSYESVLRGDYGRRRIEVDALGSRKTVIAEEPGTPGKNLNLSIDLDLQVKAQSILESTLRKFGLSRASVIVMNPNTGEILTLISLPAFDNNLFAKGISSEEYSTLLANINNPLFPRAIGASLPSGSTFKPVIAAGALTENLVTPQTTFLSTGGLMVGKWFFPDWKAEGHGLTNVSKALAESVNTYFYIVGGGYGSQEGLGVDRIVEYAKKFGFGALSGVDLPGENSGFLPSKEWKEDTKGEPWYIGDTYHLSIGQGDLLVTPLQIANMTTVFANGGKLIRPHLVNSIVFGDSSEKKTLEILNEQVVPSEYIQDVREGMRASVLSGSSRALLSLPVSSAAKTGTAQWSSTKNNHAWFTAFAPYDKPQVVITVMIEEGSEGSSVAAPVARDILDYFFRRQLPTQP